MESNVSVQGTWLLRPNETIAINPQKGKITLATRRLFNMLLYFSQIDGDKNMYSRPISEVMTLMTTSKDTEWLKNCFRQMRDIPIEWNNKDDSVEDWRISGLITEARIVRVGGSTSISWALPSIIRERLKDPRFYTKLTLEMHSKLSTGASIALYEICSRYVSNPSKVTNREAWEWWQPRLTGSAKRETSEYKYFARETLRPAIAEVNEISDIDVELIEHKNGRRIVEIQFKVVRKAGQAVDKHAAVEFDGAVLESMMRFGLSQAEARSLYVKHDLDTLRDTVAFTQRRAVAKDAPPLMSPAAFFKEALKKDYAKAPAASLAVKKSAAVAPRPASVLSTEQKRTNAIDKLTAKRILDAYELWQELGTEEQLALLRQFRDAVAIDSYSKDLNRRGVACMVSTAFRTAFCSWYAMQTWGVITDAEVLEFILQASAY